MLESFDWTISGYIFNPELLLLLVKNISLQLQIVSYLFQH